VLEGVAEGLVAHLRHRHRLGLGGAEACCAVGRLDAGGAARDVAVDLAHGENTSLTGRDGTGLRRRTNDSAAPRIVQTPDRCAGNRGVTAAASGWSILVAQVKDHPSDAGEMRISLLGALPGVLGEAAPS